MNTGAISLPPADLKKRLRELPGTRDIVVYGREPYCVMALDAVEMLRRKGLRAHRPRTTIAVAGLLTLAFLIPLPFVVIDTDPENMLETDQSVNPEVRHSLSDELWIAAGANVFGGSRPHTFFGRFGRNDNVYVTVRYSF